eukprot:3962444-Pleurochrysis_carterae.AAC.1
MPAWCVAVKNKRSQLLACDAKPLSLSQIRLRLSVIVLVTSWPTGRAPARRCWLLASSFPKVAHHSPVRPVGLALYGRLN